MNVVARRATGLVVTAMALGACSVSQRGAPAAQHVAAPAAPAGCVAAAPGDDLQAVLDAVPDGGAVCLEPGTYRGPIALPRAVNLWGPRDAIVRSRGEGTTVSITGSGARIAGFTVDGSGHRFDLGDAGVRITAAEDVRVEGVRIVRATFGVIAERAKRITIVSNDIEGTGQASLGLRGDGIRLWETVDSQVADNVVRASRDVVVWYSPRNRVERNRVEGSRYGTHLMYSSDCAVSRNRYVRDEVGVFVMYSRNATVERNVVADAGGASGMALGLKESGNVEVRENLFVHDSTGTFVDTSPLQPDDFDVFERNVFRLNGVAVLFHSTPRRTRFSGNSFRDNVTQVRVDGGGDAVGIDWELDDWDDYQGYDLNGDGIGDVPYELRSLSTDLTDARPELAFFTGAPTLALVDMAGRALPLFEPRTIVRDPRPRVSALSLGELDAD